MINICNGSDSDSIMYWVNGGIRPGGIRLHYIENSMYLNIITSDMFSIGSQSNHNDLPYNMNVYWGQPEKSSHLFINVNLLTSFS